MKTLAAGVALATVLTVSATARTLLKNPQRLLPDYVSASDVKNIPNPYIDLWTEGYPPETMGERVRSNVSVADLAIASDETLHTVKLELSIGAIRNWDTRPNNQASPM
jgi:hypothetical protein